MMNSTSITAHTKNPGENRTVELTAPGDTIIIIKRILRGLQDAGFRIIQDEKRKIYGKKGTISHNVSGFKTKTGWIEISSMIQSQTDKTCNVISTITTRSFKKNISKSKKKYWEQMYEYISNTIMLKENVDPQSKADQQMFVVKVYGWMFLALCISGLTALCAGSYQQIINAIVYNKILFYSILGAELIIVVGLTFFLKDIPSPLIPLLFIIYSLLTGLTISVVFLLYTKESIVMTFFISAGIFAVMSIYGYFTKTDLTKLGNVLFLSLIDIIIVSIFNLFLKSSTLDWITSLVSVIIFCGFIAYDTQIIKQKSILRSDGLFGDTTRTTISSALSLYLSFINLFLNLLELLGEKKD